MNINVSIFLGSGEYAADLAGNATEIAEKILTEVGGDPEKDTCSVSIQDNGTAGGYVAPPLPVDPPVEPPSGTVPVEVNSTFATNNSPPPGNNQTRTNATAFDSVSAIFVDDQSNEGDDISAKLLALMVGDSFEIRGVSDTSRYGSFVLSAAPIDQDVFVELPVSFVEAGNPLTNAACTLKFIDHS